MNPYLLVVLLVVLIGILAVILYVFDHLETKPARDAGGPRYPSWAGGDWQQPHPTTSVKPRIRDVADGISRGMGRPAQLKALGNAVVPQVAHFIAQYVLSSGVLE